MRKHSGFTLIELLVALGIMALMAGLSWRALDSMTQSQKNLSQRADEVLVLQAGLGQWAADLDALVQLPNTAAMDWDGRAFRLTRRNPAAVNDGIVVVAWTWRNAEWLRWQSPSASTRADLQNFWIMAAQWGQNAGEAEKRHEVRILPAEQWKIFYYRNDAWTNPLSTDATIPDGVRLVLTLPAGGVLSGTLTRDWVRPSLAGGKS
ncbi:MAG: hypothetical protein RIR79_1133 [Pseudomonadota bacterium]|jgi:general secretion pathway protein J